MNNAFPDTVSVPLLLCDGNSQVRVSFTEIFLISFAKPKHIKIHQDKAAAILRLVDRAQLIASSK